MSRSRSLVTIIALMVGATVFVVAVGIYVFSTNRVVRQYQAEKEKQFTALSESISNGIKDYLAADDAAGLTEAVGKLIRDKEDVQFCLVMKDDGRVVFDSTLKHIGKKYAPSKEDWGEDVKPLEREIRSGTLLLGKLRLGYTLRTPVEAERARNFIYIGKAIGTGVGNLIRNFDFYHVGQLTTRIGESYPDVVYITVYDETKNVFDEYRRDEKEGPPGGKVEELAFSVNPLKPVLVQRFGGGGADALDIAVLVEDKGETVGLVRLGYSMAGLEREMRAQQVRFAEIGLVFLAAGVLFSLLIARRVARPVQKISEAAREVGRGNLDVSVEVHSGGRELRELATNFNEMVKGLLERDRIRDTFSKYVSKQVVQELLSDPGKVVLGGARKEIVTLFCDIRDFTSMSEGETPEKVVEMLNDFFSEMVPVIFKHEGTLDKYIGDAFMAVFGSPVAVEGAADKAIECAVEVQRRMAALNERWKLEGSRSFRAGIGLNYGPAISGNIGCEERMEYTVIGDSVNVASRVEQLTRKYDVDIIATEAVVERAGGKYQARFLDKLQVKGRDESVSIYEIVIG